MNRRERGTKREKYQKTIEIENESCGCCWQKEDVFVVSVLRKNEQRIKQEQRQQQQKKETVRKLM